jgi:hypothetical protein
MFVFSLFRRIVAESEYKVQSTESKVKTVGDNGGIVAEGRGGKDETRHRLATFAPHQVAANTGTATVVAYMRRQQGKLPLPVTSMPAAAILAVLCICNQRFKVHIRLNRHAKISYSINLQVHFIMILNLNVEHLFRHLFRF